MKQSDIEVGGTYLFVATLNKDREHLVGEPFTVVEIKDVWRRFGKGGHPASRVKRYFNQDGVGARADELEPLQQDDLPF